MPAAPGRPAALPGNRTHLQVHRRPAPTQQSTAPGTSRPAHHLLPRSAAQQITMVLPHFDFYPPEEEGTIPEEEGNISDQNHITVNSGNGPPPKPWERVGTSSGPAPFKPPSGGTTSDVVEASGTAKPGEVVSPAESNVGFSGNNTVSRPLPPRPWQQQQQGYGNSYGGYGATTYNSYGGFGGAYSSGAGGLYGNNMYSGYGGGYGGSYSGSGMYGGSMYNNGMGNPYGGMGMSPYNQGPNSFGPPAPPPGFWVSFLRVLHGAVNFSGRVAFLLSQNTQAFHMFITALLQLCDKSGMLYSELVIFALRLLGVKTKPKKGKLQGAEAPSFERPGQQFVEAPKANKNSWEKVWSGDARGI